MQRLGVLPPDDYTPNTNLLCMDFKSTNYRKPLCLHIDTPP